MLNLKEFLLYSLVVITGLILLLILIIPLGLFGIFFYSLAKWRKAKLVSLNPRNLKTKHSEKRIADMLPIFSELIPKDAKSCLDIGSDRTQSNFYLKKFFDKYITLDIYNADIVQDLNIDRKIKLKDNSADLVILSNILEHLVEPVPIVFEANRIAKKYLIIGLPNEYILDKRFSFLYSLNEDRVYPWGHKHRFSLKLCEDFVKVFWKGYSAKVYKFNLPGENFLPEFVKQILLKIKPSFFAGEVFYLVKKRRITKQEISKKENLTKLYPESFVKEIFNSKELMR